MATDPKGPFVRKTTVREKLRPTNWSLVLRVLFIIKHEREPHTNERPVGPMNDKAKFENLTKRRQTGLGKLKDRPKQPEPLNSHTADRGAMRLKKIGETTQR